MITNNLPSEAPTSTSNSTLRVLLVEDSKVLAERLAEVIGQIAEVELAGVVQTEQEAIAAVRQNPFDVVILDLHLKQGSGFGVMRALITSQSKPCIIILTNYGLPEYQTAALALGADHFLDKSRDYERLPQVLNEIRSNLRMH